MQVRKIEQRKNETENEKHELERVEASFHYEITPSSQHKARKRKDNFVKQKQKAYQSRKQGQTRTKLAYQEAGESTVESNVHPFAGGKESSTAQQTQSLETTNVKPAKKKNCNNNNRNAPSKMKHSHHDSKQESKQKIGPNTITRQRKKNTK